MTERLTRRGTLRLGGTAAAIAVAGCAGNPGDSSPTETPSGSSPTETPGGSSPTETEPAGAVSFEEGFESGLSGWETAASIGPEEPLSGFDREVTRSKEQAFEGDWSLAVFTEGDHDDGTAWAVTELPDGFSDAERFEVSLQAWSQSESFNTLRHLVAVLVPTKPSDEGDFPDPGMNSSAIEDAPIGGLREPLHLAEGWREYRFTWEPANTPSRLFLAVGVSVVWEADATHYLDAVRVTGE